MWWTPYVSNPIISIKKEIHIELIFQISLYRGPFFCPHQFKPKASDFVLMAQERQSPVGLSRQKQRDGTGPLLKIA